MEQFKAIPHVTQNMLAEFHQAKGVKNASCLRCGCDLWTLMSSAEIPANGWPSASTEERANVDLFFPVLTLACKNCGTTWTTSMLTIMDWFDERSKQGNAP